jgi:hypothetical protein
MGLALRQAREKLADRDSTIATGEPGFYLQFDIPKAQTEALDALENKPKAIELVAVRPPAADDDFVSATVFIPARSAEFYAHKIEQYRDEETPSGKPKHERLIARIETVRLGLVQALFTDAVESYPASDRQVWWEVWLRDGRLDEFRPVASALGLELREHTLTFPERDVVLLLADEAALARLATNTDAIAELRLAKDTPTLFLEMQPVEQADWVADLESRITGPSRNAPAVCLLDSGAVRGHPLIAPALLVADQYAYDSAWGVDDGSGPWKGHGTGMAGVALYGDLEAALTRSTPIVLRHRLETVKILPRRGHNPPVLYGAITATSVAMVEARSPRRLRTFCMAVTSDVGMGRGRPSSWSATIDQLAYGDGGNRRLFVLAAGNIREDITASDYPDDNDLAEAENPSQAWNALVAGAYTGKITIGHPDYQDWEPVAPAGDLCPTSRTSGVWDRQWPIRPDVVFEGGNQAHDGSSAPVPIDDLQLLTTHYRPTERLLDTFGETSAATAQAARLSAQIMATRPELWHETVRGLVVHTAEWTPVMRRHIDQSTSQAQKMAMLRRYGWGVPTWRRALYSANNDATLMVEDALLPFRKDGSAVKTRNMNLHRLPWPRDELLSLGRQDVELRITLSYFIEPNPGERGWTRRHRYASHGLRFALKRSHETHDQFRQRINRAVEAEEAGQAFSASGDDWVLGPTVRDRGSLHSDIWRGSAAELADRDAVGVFPISGWWKENPGLQRWDRSARYALIVSVRAPESEVDLYTAIANRIGIEISAS